MASQGERESGVLEIDVMLDEPMAQDGDPEQEMLVVEEQELPQMDPEPEMGAAAAAAYDTSPPLLRNPPPIPAETAQPSALDMILQALSGMENRIMQAFRSEMRQMGHGLQAA